MEPACMPDPILVGRNADKLQQLAHAHGIERWTTDVDKALADPRDEIFFDAASTQLRPQLLKRAIAAGKHVYCEKPTATTTAEALELYHARTTRRRQARRRAGQAVAARIAQAQAAARQRLLRPHAVGARRIRLLGIRGRLAARAAPVVELPQGRRRRHHLDMLCHWRYVLDNLFGERASRLVPRRHAHSASAGTRTASRTRATAEDAAYATFELANGTVAHFNSSWACACAATIC